MAQSIPPEQAADEASPDPPNVLDEIDRRIAAERSAREIALNAQDHRLVPALSALGWALMARSVDRRRERVLASATAALWCLVPSAGTATIGAVALASLVLTWQQARLLSIQNDKIEVQNLLSEAQRRSGLLFETTAIFQAIDEEKKKAAGSVCDAAASETCWKPLTEGGTLFVPSGATTGRIAALTQALRPYRYLSVEDARPYRFVGNDGQAEICPQKIQSQTLDQAAILITRAERAWSDDDRVLREPNRLKAEILSIYGAGQRQIQSPLDAAFRGFVRHASALVDTVTGRMPFDGDIALNCAPASPERGQLLISLHAAGVDVSRISARGGDFRYSDIPGAYLRGIVLDGVDLSHSRLPGANFTEARLNGVSFAGAHLSGARFRGAHLSQVSFEGAIIQTFSDGAASSGPFTAGSATNNSLNGMRFVERSAKDDLHLRLCTAVSLISRIGEGQRELAREARHLPMMEELRRFAMLVETSIVEPGRPAQLIGVIVAKLADERLILHEATAGEPQATRLEYVPFSLCRWPPNPVVTPKP